MASAAPQVVLIDAGSGNLHSVRKALTRVGARVVVTQDPEVVRRAPRLVLPGVGAFGDFMQGLRTPGLDQAVTEAVARGVPMLGICVGMQALFEVGHEMGTHRGLGLLPGEVVRFPADVGEKVPHTGWNQIHPLRPSPLLEGIPPGAYVFFNHSYYCRPAQEEVVVARTDFGRLNYASMVQRGPLFGVQFHPEKSQRVGLRLLTNFLRFAP
ncbi:MAG: imidazole glycerol phosphate synthase subunit HisH [Chloroflexi bacterium]|nr:imidazole glycerol phosphate synthase subunit HisH [Chloroflexota bacterium]